ncbi:MAG TPA: Ran-binding zinc finger domain-containing protein [Gemmatimonadaceae bacterium]
MTSSMTKAMDDLNTLLEERAQYEKWIAQLTAKREQTPPHVFERVRTDYVSRLDSVMSHLRSRAEGLQASASTLEERVAALTTEESTRRDARAEIELRSMVGEYSTERAQSELSICDVDINRLESERTTAMAELGRLQEILALIRQPDARPAPAPTHRPLGAPAAHAEPHSAVDELAFLNSVVDRQANPAPAAPAAHPAPAPAAVPAPRIEDVPLVTSLEAAERSEAEAAAREPQTMRETAGTPAFLKGMPTEQAKTLKCQECGTMNYATEWYCERCGGELAAM